MEIKEAVKRMLGLRKQYPNYVLDVDKYLSKDSLNESVNPYEEMLFYVSRETNIDPLTLSTLNEAEISKVIDFDDIVNVTEEFGEAKQEYQKSVGQQLKTLGKKEEPKKKEEVYANNVDFLNKLSKKTLFRLVGDIDAYKAAKAQIKIIREHKKIYQGNPKFDEDLQALESVIEIFENALKNPTEVGKAKKETAEYKRESREISAKYKALDLEIKGYKPSSIANLFISLKTDVMPVYDDDVISDYPEKAGEGYNVYDPTITNAVDKLCNLLYYIADLTGLDVFEIYNMSVSKLKKALNSVKYKLTDKLEELEKEKELTKIDMMTLSSSAYGTTASEVALKHYGGDKKKAISLIMASYTQSVISIALNIAKNYGSQDYLDDLIQEGLLFANIEAENYIDIWGSRENPISFPSFINSKVSLYLRKYAVGLKKGGIMGATTAMVLATADMREFNKFKERIISIDPEARFWDDEKWKVEYSLSRIKQGKESMLNGDAKIVSADSEDEEGKKVFELKSDYDTESMFMSNDALGQLDDAFRDYIEIINTRNINGLRIFSAADVLILDRLAGFVENKRNTQSKWFWTFTDIAKDLKVSDSTINSKFSTNTSTIFDKLELVGKENRRLKKSIDIITKYIKYLYRKDNKNLRGIFYLLPRLTELVQEEVTKVESNIVKTQNGQFDFRDQVLIRMKKNNGDYGKPYTYVDFLTGKSETYQPKK